MRRYLNKLGFVYHVTQGLSQFGNLVRIIIINKIAYIMQLQKLRSKPTAVCLQVNGNFLPFKMRYSDIATFFEVFSQKSYDFDFNIRSEPTIIDLGGHIGLAALFLISKYNPATIISLEPEEKNFHLLQSNLPNSIVINKAISNIDGTSFLEINNESVNHKIANKGLPVQTISLRSIIDEYKLEQIDLLKIDIEGHELVLFESPAPWINYVQNIIMELHGNFSITLLEDKLGPYGFNVKMYKNDIVVAQRAS